jgi:cell division septation protein DedD
MVALSKAFADRNKEILEDTRFRFKQGYGPAGDIARVESYVAAAEGEVARYERNLSTASAHYIEIFGTEPPQLLDRPAQPSTAAKDYETSLSLSRNVPSVASSEARLLDAKRGWRAVRADRLPRITAVVDASRYDILGANSDYDIRGRIVLNHSFSGKTIGSSRTGQAKARVEQAEFALEQAINEAERNAGVAFKDIEALEHQLASLTQAYIANRRTRDIDVEQLKVSRGNLIDLLRTEKEFFDSAGAFVQGTVELDMARYSLLARTGELLDYFSVAFDFDNNSARTTAKDAVPFENRLQPVPPVVATQIASADKTANGSAAPASDTEKRKPTLPPAKGEAALSSAGGLKSSSAGGLKSDAQNKILDGHNSPASPKPAYIPPAPAITPAMAARKTVTAPPSVTTALVAQTSDHKIKPAPSAPALAPAAKAKPASPAGTGWSVQLGAFSNMDNAKSHWKNMQGKIAALSKLQPLLVKAGPLIRVRTQPIFNRTDANKICVSAEAAGQNCFIVAP